MADAGNGSVVARAFRVAVTQWHATRDLRANLSIAVNLIRQAGTQAADLVLLPENGLFLGTNQEMRAAALRLDSMEIQTLRSSAAAARCVVVLGGFKRKDEAGRIFNTALVIGPRGEILGGYDKIHLFDATVGGQSFRASSVENRGDRPGILLLPGAKVGLTICYDIRFPELYRTLALAGAEIILVPSAFTRVTGQAHWDVLLRARAIETGTYIVASATVRGVHGGDAVETYGHALVVDPWGEVLTDLGEAQQHCAVVSLDLRKVAEVREKLPVLHGIQPDACSRAPALIDATESGGPIMAALPPAMGA